VSATREVIVVGAGIAGACAAHFLAEAGASVLLVDRGEVASGTTGLGEGNVLLSDKRPGPELELARESQAAWLELAERFPQARVAAKGAIVLGARPEEVPVACEAIDEVSALEPAVAPGATGVFVPGELQVDPRGLTHALAAGVPTQTGAEVERIEPGGGVTLTTGERLSADHVVLAAGPWSAALAPIPLPLEPRKGQLMALAAPPGTVRHKLYEASYLDAIEAPDADLQVAAVVEQTLDGDEVLVGSSRERVGFDAAVDEGVLEAMLERAARWLPGLRDLPRTRAWVGFRPWLPDGLPALGPSKRAPGLHLCTGHEGAGVGLAPASGQLVARALLDGAPVPAAFDPDRYAAAGRREDSRAS
jgi:D-hydroxyproline dehydrogenase subunit beta